jgi:signal transduction histidine kinase
LVSNVIGTALKYTPADRPARIQVSARAEAGSWVRIDIRDHGIGLPASEHEKVFVTFHRAHSEYPGTGLGLAICHRIVERHGGVIGVEDNPGGGSLFHFTLPVGAGSAEPAGLFRQGGRGGSERSGQTAGGRR